MNVRMSLLKEAILNLSTLSTCARCGGLLPEGQPYQRYNDRGQPIHDSCPVPGTAEITADLVAVLKDIALSLRIIAERTQ